MLSLFFKRIRSIVTMMLVSIMVIAGLAAPASAAQNQTVQSQLTGVTISYGPQYTIQPDGVYEANTMEMLMFIGPADVLAVGFMSPMLDINSARDIILESLIGAGFSTQSIDRGDYSGVSYSLDMMNLEGVEMGVFTLFLSGRSHGYSEFYIVMAPPSLFASTMQNAQNSFTVDGAQLMNGVDANVMGNMVVANQGITGGTSATDVEVVTGDDANTSETTTTETTTAQTTTTETTSGGAERETYLASVQTEYETVTAEMAAVINALNGMRDEELTAEESFAIIEASTTVLAGTSNRIAGIQAPAGMEGFHQEFVAWAADISAAGAGWATAKQTGNVDDFNNAFETGLNSHAAFGDTLEAELANTGSATEEANETTTTTETTSGGMDRDSYLAAVQAEYVSVTLEITSILDLLDQLSAGEITAQEARPGIDAAHNVLAGTTGRIEAIQPPAGMEQFHQEFVGWAGTMTDLGNGWIDAVATGNTDAYNAMFSPAIDTHVAFGETLDAEISASTTSTSSEGAATEEATEEAAETGRTSRTTRTTSTGEADPTEEATDTSRTTRTTRTTSTDTTDPTAEATETSRTSRSSSSSSSNSSETGSRTSTTRTGSRTSSSTGTADRDDYLEAVRAEYDLVSENLTIIQDMLQQLSDGTVEDSVAIQTINDANVELADAETRIADLEAPEGLEAFHEDFLDWSESVVGVGESWNDFVNGDIDAKAYIDLLLVLVEDTETFGDLLKDEEAAGATGVTVAAISTREMMAA